MISYDNEHLEQEVEEENYFVSMTDMMVGLVFIFIILMMYYALQFRQEADARTSANTERAIILNHVADELKKQNIIVTVDQANGVLRLPDQTLFDSGQAQLKPEGAKTVRALADALMRVMPCYASGVKSTMTCRPESEKIKVDSLFIEGHTDSDPFNGSGGRTNLDLSAERAINTFRKLIIDQPQLEVLSSAQADGSPKAILSVSGYGDKRPVDRGTSLEAKAKNRRIDIRILMAAPSNEATRAIAGEMGLKP